MAEHMESRKCKASRVTVETDHVDPPRYLQLYDGDEYFVLALQLLSCWNNDKNVAELWNTSNISRAISNSSFLQGLEPEAHTLLCFSERVACAAPHEVVKVYFTALLLAVESMIKMRSAPLKARPETSRHLAGVLLFVRTCAGKLDWQQALLRNPALLFLRMLQEVDIVNLLTQALVKPARGPDDLSVIQMKFQYNSLVRKLIRVLSAQSSSWRELDFNSGFGRSMSRLFIKL